MIVKNLSDVRGTPKSVEWGNGVSLRLITEGDGMGFAVCHTTVRAGTTSRLEYKNHLEACFCIAGRGEIEPVGGEAHPIEPGVIYALDKHDQHFLRAADDEDLILLSIFNPPLKGDERHSLQSGSSSGY